MAIRTYFNILDLVGTNAESYIELNLPGFLKRVNIGGYYTGTSNNFRSKIVLGPDQVIPVSNTTGEIQFERFSPACKGVKIYVLTSVTCTYYVYVEYETLNDAKNFRSR